MIDTHCHLNDPRFEDDAPAAAKRALDAGVVGFLIAGYDLASSGRALQLAELPGAWAAGGIHPHDASCINQTPRWEDALADALKSSSRVAALGEIGLDFHYMHSPKHVQEEAFRRQIRLAHDIGLPVTVHTRAAEDRTIEILDEESLPAAGAVLHAFTGTPEQASRAVAMGCFIGCTGMVTFRKVDALREMLRVVPLDRLLLETDCPYLAPHPLRGKRNEPAFLTYVRDAVAQLFGCSPEEVARQTTKNALTVFTAMKEEPGNG